MNQESTPPPSEFSRAELLHLIREGNPPLTRREIRQRDEALEAGLLVRIDGGFALAPDDTAAAAPATQISTPPAPVATPGAPDGSGTGEPPVITSVDVLAGKVPAASGLTRRELREIAQQHAAPETAAGETLTPKAVPAQAHPPVIPPARRSIAPVDESPALATPGPTAPTPPSPRRPVVRPEGAATGEYTGQFEQIREALANSGTLPAITQENAPAGAVPDAAESSQPEAPQRRSIFHAALPPELSGADEADVDELTDTNAADLSSVMTTPMVTDNLIPELTAEFSAVQTPRQEDAEEPPAGAARGDADWAAPAVEEEPDPGPRVGEKDNGDSGQPRRSMPDWHTLTELPRMEQAPRSEKPRGAVTDSAPTQGQRRKPSLPLWLVLLQWIVIAVVAVVLGLLVWYAINMGFGSQEAAPAGIISPDFYLRI